MFRGLANIFGVIVTGVATLVIAGEIKKRLDKPQDIITAVENKQPQVSFLIFGGRQVGKTSLVNWLKSMNNRDAQFVLDKSYQPTLPTGDDVPEMLINLSDNKYNIAIPVDVSGDHSGPINAWEQVYQDHRLKLNGLIFMIDHASQIPPEKHQIVWDRMISIFKEDKGAFKDNIKALYIIINKSDLWSNDITATDIIETHYKQQFETTQIIAKRLNWNLKVEAMSLEKEYNVQDIITSFAKDITSKAN